MSCKSNRTLAIAGNLAALLLSLTLLSCSGGGGGDDSSAPAAPPAPPPGGSDVVLLTGTAATGGPVSGTVTLKDSSAQTRTRTVATASDGSFSFDVTDLVAPFLLRVAYGNPSAPSAMYSLAAAPGNANITPLTSMAVRAAIGGADVDAFFDRAGAGEIAAAASNLPRALGDLRSGLAPLLQRFGAQGDPIATPFTADHAGIDALMDAIAVDFRGAQVVVADRVSGATLFSAPAANLSAGTFDAANLDRLGAPAPAPGGSLYTLYCAGCHGALSESAKRGITVARLQAAIAGDVGGMGFLSGLSSADVASIVAALDAGGATGTPADPVPPPSTPPDGATLYGSNCAGCHGALAGSTKLGATSVRIQNAIAGGVGGMSALSSLSAAEIQAIAAALATQAPPAPPDPGPVPVTPDGEALYATNCSGCHGPLGSSTKQGISIARLQSAISSNAGGMGSLSTLSVSEIQAIVTALTPGTPTPTPTPPPTAPDGAALYAASCAGCHGALASSTKAGATVSRIQGAIAGNAGGMGSLSALSATDVQAIADALAASAPPPPPPVGTADGPTLYAQYCASCHGSLASSTKGRASASSIQVAIAANTGGMGSLVALQTAQIDAIAAALASIAPVSGACGSCHAIPPALGQHGEHAKFSCATCHGVGYGKTTVNAATHANGVVDLVTGIGWTSGSASCANSCHGRESWNESDRD